MLSPCLFLPPESFTVLLELVRHRREARDSAAEVAALSKLLEKEHAVVKQVGMPLLVVLLDPAGNQQSP